MEPRNRIRRFDCVARLIKRENNSDGLGNGLIVVIQKVAAANRPFRRKGGRLPHYVPSYDLTDKRTTLKRSF